MLLASLLPALAQAPDRVRIGDFAIDRTEVLPLDERGKVPPMLLEFRPNDF